MPSTVGEQSQLQASGRLYLGPEYFRSFTEGGKELHPTFGLDDVGAYIGVARGLSHGDLFLRFDLDGLRVAGSSDDSVRSNKGVGRYRMKWDVVSDQGGGANHAVQLEGTQQEGLRLLVDGVVRELTDGAKFTLRHDSEGRLVIVPSSNELD